MKQVRVIRVFLSAQLPARFDVRRIENVAATCRQRALRSLTAGAIAALIAASAALSALPVANLAVADSPAASRPTIRVLVAWIRWLPGGLPAAGYLTLTNTGNKALALDGASSAFYRDVSIHRSVANGTTVEMTPVKELTLEPHATLEFESSGYHLMLMQPAASADTAPEVPITLHFSDGSLLVVPFQVRKKPAGDSASPR
jgi:copper(I)-binding protein